MVIIFVMILDFLMIKTFVILYSKSSLVYLVVKLIMTEL